jgi:hypothetical protein
MAPIVAQNTFREFIAQVLIKKFENKKKNEAQEAVLDIIFPFEV